MSRYFTGYTMDSKTEVEKPQNVRVAESRAEDTAETSAENGTVTEQPVRGIPQFPSTRRDVMLTEEDATASDVHAAEVKLERWRRHWCKWPA